MMGFDFLLKSMGLENLPGEIQRLQAAGAFDKILEFANNSERIALAIEANSKSIDALASIIERAISGVENDERDIVKPYTAARSIGLIEHAGNIAGDMLGTSNPHS